MEFKAIELYYTIYIHTMPDGKKYIGQTVQQPNDRWVNGYGYRNNPRFFEAIQEVGWDNIEHEIFYQTKIREEADVCEKALIKKYKTTDPQYGYNRTEECHGADMPFDIGKRLYYLEMHLGRIEDSLMMIESAIEELRKSNG